MCSACSPIEGIVRNRLKIEAAIRNAQGVLDILESFLVLLICLSGGMLITTSRQNAWKSLDKLQGRTEISDRMSRDLKKRRFNFVGPTICYAFMQAVGMVNDHTVGCFRYKEVRRMSRQDKSGALGKPIDSIPDRPG